MKYIYTNSSDKTELDNYLNDVAITAFNHQKDGGFAIVYVEDKPQLVGKIRGVSRPDKQRTNAFDIANKKHGAEGYYCLNASDYFKDNEWVTALPDYQNYSGLMVIDNVDIWVDSEGI